MTGSIRFRQSIPLVVIAAIACTFGTICIIYTIYCWSDVPYYDEWRLVKYIDDWNKGTLGWMSVFDRDDGHRIVLSRILEIFGAAFFREDPRVEMVAGLVFLVLTAVVFWMREVWADRRLAFLDGLILVSVFATLFSLRNWENLLGPWATNTAASTFFFLLALIAVDREGPYALAGAVASAIACSLCFSNGMLIWPIGLLYVAIARGRRDAMIWLVAAAVYLPFYLRGLGTFGAGGGTNPLIVAGRLMTLIGQTLSVDQAVLSGGVVGHVPIHLAIVVGALLSSAIVAMTIVLFANSEIADRRFPLAILLYGGLSCGMIAVGHSNLGVVQAFTARYFPTTSLIFIGVLLLLRDSPTLRGMEIARCGAAVIAGLVLVSALVAIDSERSIGPWRKKSLDHWREEVLNYKAATNDDLANPHFPPDLIRERAAILEKNHYHPWKRQGATQLFPAAGLSIVDFGPRDIVHGVPFNVQPDGASAIWVTVSRPVSPDAKLVLGATTLATQAIGTLLTAVVPPEAFSNSGVYELKVVEDPSGSNQTSLGAAWVVR